MGACPVLLEPTSPAAESGTKYTGCEYPADQPIHQPHSPTHPPIHPLRFVSHFPGTEHWFQLKDDADRLAAVEDHMRCVEACFHTKHDEAASPYPFHYTLDLGAARGRAGGRV